MTIRFFRVGPGSPATETSSRAPGDAIAVRIDELAPQTRFAVRAARQFRGATFESLLDLESSGDGTIDTTADPDRLFWSMRRTDSASAIDDGIAVSVEQDGARVAEARLGLDRMHPGVREEPVGDGLVGALFLPDSTAARPAILTLGGSDGGLERAAHTAAALASQGFVALALAYFGAPGLPKGLVDVPLEYFAQALAVLRAHPAVWPGEIGVLGRSRGGELALLLGATFPEVAAVAALVPSPLRWCGTDGPGTAAWRRNGAASPYLAAAGQMRMERASDGRVVYATTPRFEATLDASDDDAIARAMISIEETRGPILLISADDDRVWPSRRLAELAMARLAGRDARDAWISYPNAGHSATAVPGDPTTEPATFHPIAGIWLGTGGTPEGNAHAQRDGWGRILEFFRRSFDRL